MTEPHSAQVKVEPQMNEQPRTGMITLHNELTTPEGQLANNPGISPADAELAARREYNRRNSARARLRGKYALQQLQEACDELEERTEMMEKENEKLRKKIKKRMARKKRRRELMELKNSKKHRTELDKKRPPAVVNVSHDRWEQEEKIPELLAIASNFDDTQDLVQNIVQLQQQLSTRVQELRQLVTARGGKL